MTKLVKLWGLFDTGTRLEIESNDTACRIVVRRWPTVALKYGLYPGKDESALRRARREAKRGRRLAIECVAIHQHEKRLNRRTHA